MPTWIAVVIAIGAIAVLALVLVAGVMVMMGAAMLDSDSDDRQ